MSESQPFETGARESLAVTAYLARHQQAERKRAETRNMAPWGLVIALNVAFALTMLGREDVRAFIVGKLFWAGGGALAGAGAVLAFVLLVVGGRAVGHSAGLSSYFLLAHNRWLIGPWRARVGPEGLTFTSSLSTQLYAWPVIWALGRDDKYAYFLTSTSAGMVVPRSAFPSDEEFRAFVAEAERHREAASQAPFDALKGGAS